MKPHTVYSIQYYTQRLIPADKEKEIQARKSNPTPEAQVHIAAYSQEAAIAHAKTVIHRDARDGVKPENREITVTSVQQGLRVVHVHVAPPAMVVEDGASVFTKEQLDKAVADAVKAALTAQQAANKVPTTEPAK